MVLLLFEKNDNMDLTHFVINGRSFSLLIHEKSVAVMGRLARKKVVCLGKIVCKARLHTKKAVRPGKMVGKVRLRTKTVVHPVKKLGKLAFVKYIIKVTNFQID
ncbi:hypothetical protein PU629_08655 [Pullulanibacillus sp. KACC 23026]|uniref:hypothetical protein n=1 Tax=Pullulanibacillus sp. KACC 23026 TaxID=3028315 RepID=UPI0023B151B1|nr:hypothetical protein [Pullulanibacillus sp. KACC 23026]WEG14411.1 hypothetical protein PU629_08655 [Pullulanibacillus sp. KACC 23026]